LAAHLPSATAVNQIHNVSKTISHYFLPLNLYSALLAMLLTKALTRTLARSFHRASSRG